MRAASPPRQIESENEMIVILHHLFCSVFSHLHRAASVLMLLHGLLKCEMKRCCRSSVIRSISRTLTYCKIFFPLFFLERLYAKIIRLCRKKKALCRYFFIESNISLGIMGLSCFFGVFVKVKEDGGLWVIFL